MLTIKQELRKLLEINDPLKPEEVIPTVLPEPTTDEKVEPEIPIDMEAVAREEAEQAARERELRKAQWKEEQIKKSAEEKTKRAEEAADKKAKADSEDSPVNSEFYKIGSGTAAHLRSFFEYFLKQNNLISVLSQSLTPNFNPEKNATFTKAINKLVTFYSQISSAIKNKTINSYVENLLTNYEGSFFSDDDPEKHRKMMLTSSNTSAQAIRNFIASGNNIISIDETLLEQHLVNMYVACNIIHYYMMLKYYKLSPRGIADTEDTKIFINMFTTSHKDQDYMNSWQFKDLKSPAKETLSGFLASDDVFAVYTKNYLGSKAGSDIETARYDAGAVSQDDKKKKAAFAEKLRKKTLKQQAIRQQQRDGAALSEDRTADVGTSDVFNEFFIENVTIWLLAAVLLSDPNKDLPKKVFSNTFNAMSLGNTAGEASPGVAVGNYGGSLNSEDNITDAEDVYSDNAFDIAEEAEQLHTKFGSIQAKIEETFGVSLESTNLTTVLSNVFASIPKDFFGNLYSYYTVDSAGDISKTNLLEDYKKFVLSGKLVKKEATAQNLSGTAKYNIITELGTILTFVQDKSDLSDIRIARMMTNLPKTLEEAEDAFPVSKTSDTKNKFKNALTDPISGQIQDWFTEIKALAPRFDKEVSSGLGSNIEPKYFNPSGNISKTFGLDLAIKEKVSLRRRSPVLDYTKPLPMIKEDLSNAFDDWYDAVEDILMPVNNVENWGLLKPTSSSITRASRAKIDFSETWIVYPNYIGGKTHTTEVGKRYKTRVDGNIYDSSVEYTAVAKAVLNKLKELKSKFLKVKNLSEIQDLLSQIVTEIPELPEPKNKYFKTNPRPLLAFRSPGTVQYDTDGGKTKNTILADLIDPVYATDNTTLTRINPENAIETSKTAQGGSALVNVFVTFARAAIIINNLSISENIINNYIKALFEEEDKRKTWASVQNKLLQQATINIHLQAQLLLAIAQLYRFAYRILVLMTGLIKKLPPLTVVPALKLSNSHYASEFTGTVLDILTKAVVAMITKSNDISPKQVEDYALGEINAEFAKIEKDAEDTQKITGRIKTTAARWANI